MDGAAARYLTFLDSEESPDMAPQAAIAIFNLRSVVCDNVTAMDAGGFETTELTAACDDG